MIKTFAGRHTRQFWETGKSKGVSPANLRNVARRKLQMLDAASRLEDLRQVPGNRLEELSFDRAGQFSIRINAQFRICFLWKDGNTYEVEITDYH